MDGTTTLLVFGKTIFLENALGQPLSEEIVGK